MWNALRSRLRGRSPVQVGLLAGKTLAHAARNQMPDRRAARAADGAFDRRFGTDTSAQVMGSRLGFAEDIRGECHHYQASSAEMLTAPVARMGIDPARWDFIDYGAGKGRMVMVAAEMGFASAIGVELSRVLCDVAEANYRLFAAACPDAARPATACADATVYRPQGERLLVYLYNPFGAELMARMLPRLEEAPARELRVIYANPQHAAVFAGARWDTTRLDADILLATRR